MITKSRYLTRLKAMMSMSTSTENGGESEVAKDRLKAELAKFKDYGFPSEDVLKSSLAALDADLEKFYDGDFCKVEFSVGNKRPEKWKVYLISACALQQQCMSVKTGSGAVLLFGPSERVDSVIWLYNQLVKDVTVNRDLAWKGLSDSERSKENRRSFNHSYSLMVCLNFHRREKKRREDRVTKAANQTPGLVPTSGVLDIRSEKFARSQVEFANVWINNSTTSQTGSSHGQKDSDKIGNRRIVSNARSIPGS